MKARIRDCRYPCLLETKGSKHLELLGHVRHDEGSKDRVAAGPLTQRPGLDPPTLAVAHWHDPRVRVKDGVGHTSNQAKPYCSSLQAGAESDSLQQACTTKNISTNLLDNPEGRRCAVAQVVNKDMRESSPRESLALLQQRCVCRREDEDGIAGALRVGHPIGSEGPLGICCWYLWQALFFVHQCRCQPEPR